MLGCSSCACTLRGAARPHVVYDLVLARCCLPGMANLLLHVPHSFETCGIAGAERESGECLNLPKYVLVCYDKELHESTSERLSM